MSRKLALLFSGLHYLHDKELKHGCASKIIDFRHQYRNIQEYIIEYFEKKGYTIDTFISTNRSIISNDLLRMYKPVKYVFVEDTPDRRVTKTRELLQLLINHMESTGYDADLICITRFDIYFLEELANIDPTKFNLFSKVLTVGTINEGLIDDNFYIFPKKMLRTFFNIFKDNKPNIRIISARAHWLLPQLEKHFDLHYIKEELAVVANLTSFKLRFFESRELILNKYLYTENVRYPSKNSSAEISIYKTNNVHFTKCVKEVSTYAWFGYEMAAGVYEMSFHICSDKDISTNFIKLHNPVIYISCQSIMKDITQFVSVRFTVSNDKTLLAFIFDNYEDCLDIHFTDITTECVSLREKES
jgi:hypothetical protein